MRTALALVVGLLVGIAAGAGGYAVLEKHAPEPYCFSRTVSGGYFGAESHERTKAKCIEREVK